MKERPDKTVCQFYMNKKFVGGRRVNLMKPFRYYVMELGVPVTVAVTQISGKRATIEVTVSSRVPLSLTLCRHVEKLIENYIYSKFL